MENISTFQERVTVIISAKKIILTTNNVLFIDSYLFFKEFQEILKLKK